MGILAAVTTVLWSPKILSDQMKADDNGSAFHAIASA